MREYSMTLASLFFFGTCSTRALVHILLTAALLAILSTGNEIWQSLYGEGRGYAFRDVVFALAGILCAFIASGSYWLLRQWFSGRIKRSWLPGKAGHG